MNLHDPDQEISFAEAMRVVERHAESRVFWIAKAMTLLQMVGANGIDQTKLAAECRSHVDAVPSP